MCLCQRAPAIQNKDGRKRPFARKYNICYFGLILIVRRMFNKGGLLSKNITNTDESTISNIARGTKRWILSTMAIDFEFSLHEPGTKIADPQRKRLHSFRAKLVLCTNCTQL